MQATMVAEKVLSGNVPGKQGNPTFPEQKKVSRLEETLVWLRIKSRIFFITLIKLRSFSKTMQVFREMNERRTNTWGGTMKKIYKVDGKYFFNLYTPGWPSARYDQLIGNEIRRLLSADQATEQLRLIFLAVTTKCPLRCEHCFEWNNLNHKETFTRDELIKIVDIYQREGVNQIQFSGGEPMVRFRDLLEVVRHAALKCECYIVTSGFNLTMDNARLLKSAGCRGMIISIDHYIPEMHNQFRHHPKIFEQAVAGVRASLQTGMITAVSVCATREFLDGGHLAPYMDFAHSLGVYFVQVLEPKAVGHYEGKDVLLEEIHLQTLEEFFKKINRDPAYSAYPIVMYHGYHQRRIGCYAGNRSVYIDAVGNVHACPFCHTHSYNIRTVLDAQTKVLPVKENSCPRYGKVV